MTKSSSIKSVVVNAHALKRTRGGLVFQIKKGCPMKKILFIGQPFSI